MDEVEFKKSSFHAWAVFGLFILFAIVAPIGAIRQDIPVLFLATPVLLLLSLVPFRIARNPPVFLRLTGADFYTGEHHVTVPWILVNSVQLVNATERMSSLHKGILKAAGDRQREDLYVIGIEFTPNGREELGTGFGIQMPSMYPSEDMVLSLLSISLHNSPFPTQDALIGEMQRRHSVAIQ